MPAWLTDSLPAETHNRVAMWLAIVPAQVDIYTASHDPVTADNYSEPARLLEYAIETGDGEVGIALQIDDIHTAPTVTLFVATVSAGQDGTDTIALPQASIHRVKGAGNRDLEVEVPVRWAANRHLLPPTGTTVQEHAQDGLQQLQYFLDDPLQRTQRLAVTLHGQEGDEADRMTLGELHVASAMTFHLPGNVVVDVISSASLTHEQQQMLTSPRRKERYLPEHEPPLLCFESIPFHGVLAMNLAEKVELELEVNTFGNFELATLRLRQSLPPNHLRPACVD